MENRMRENRRKRRTISGALLAAAFFAALWGVPSYAEPDSAELDLTKGDIVITNSGYTQGGGEPVIHDGRYTITSSGSKPVDHTITIESDLVEVTLKDVMIASKKSPISLMGDSKHAMARLRLDGTNVLQSIEGDHAGIAVPQGAYLVIEESGGSLSVTGSGSGAGIGGTGKEDAPEGSSPENGGNVTIHGGIVTVTGGLTGGSGIGGAAGGSGGIIEITGGYITASASTNGTGIGSSPEWKNQEMAGSIKITGGVVKVNGSLGAGEDVLTGADNETPWVEADRVGGRIGSFSGMLFQESQGRIYGNQTYVIDSDRTILSGNTLRLSSKDILEIREGAALTINGAMENEGALRLASEDSMKLGKEGKLSGRGKFTVPGITADMISVPVNLVYEAETSEEGEITDITESVLEQITLNRNKRGTKELFGVEFTVIPDFTGWETKEIDWPIMEPGAYTVTYSKEGEKSLSKRFMVYSPGDAVREGLSSIEVFQKPSKMKYGYGDPFDGTDLIVVGTYEDGSIRNMTALVHVEWEDFELGEHRVEVTCERDGDRQPIKCYLEGITIVPKEIDVSGMSWNLQDFVYDGMEKTVTLGGILPEGVIADRTTSTGKDAGTYEAVVNFTLSGSMDKDHYTIVGPNPLREEWKIEPKELTWDTNSLSALGQAGESKDHKISLYGTLRAEGILSQDIENSECEWPASRLEGFYEGTEAGEQEVTLSWKGGWEPSPGNNYCLPKEMPVILGVMNDVKALPQPEELAGDGKTYHQEMEIGISHVPDTLAEDPKLSQPKGIETRMRTAITDHDPSVLITNTNVYDIRLLVQQDGGTWEKVASDAYPEDGITVTLPYPSNTGKGGPYEFTAAHMYTEKKGSHKPGDIEYLAVTQTADGIQFRVTSLSPVSIGWRTAGAGASGDDSSASGKFKGNIAFVMICALMAVITIVALAVIVRIGILPRLKKKEKKKDIPHKHIDFRA